MNKKMKCAIIGSGNIGTDLMIKLARSEYLEPSVMIGIDPNSEGLRMAKENGMQVSHEGIEGFKQLQEGIDIVFEATSAHAHAANAPILKEMGKFAIDLTPAAVGPFVVPAVNLTEELIHNEANVNMVTCGGQATVPIVHAVSEVVDVEYAEIVSSVSSKSAGPGTRQNIDEFTETTSKALEVVGRAKKGKTLIIINPAEPPILMRNTVYVQIAEYSEQLYEEIRQALDARVEVMKQYVPGYRYKAEPVFKENVVTVQIEVEGMGDFLPTYAGNLDIITAAAIRTAEQYAQVKGASK